jgi:hypothetical protein
MILTLTPYLFFIHVDGTNFFLLFGSYIQNIISSIGGYFENFNVLRRKYLHPYLFSCIPTPYKWPLPWHISLYVSFEVLYIENIPKKNHNFFWHSMMPRLSFLYLLILTIANFSGKNEACQNCKTTKEVWSNFVEIY